MVCTLNGIAFHLNKEQSTETDETQILKPAMNDHVLYDFTSMKCQE